MADHLDDFLALSETLTGFSRYELSGTGQAALYLSIVAQECGEAGLAALLDAHRKVKAAGDETAADRAMRTLVLSDETLGPLARALVKLWYTGTWNALPPEWRERHGGGARGTFVASPTSYTEGLLWPAVGANPSGAKPFGYGTWALPPRVGLD